MAARLIGRHVVALVAASLIAACAAQSARSALSVDADGARIFLVRHAEKQSGEDPGLTGRGQERAAALASRLGDEGVTEIWSTRTRRTEETAAPLAAQLGLAVKTYDPFALEALAETLKAAPGVVLVVGHSNTTPDLARYLGADPGPTFDEAAEFDRLYVISEDAQGNVRSRIERYGAPSEAQRGGAE